MNQRKAADVYPFLEAFITHKEAQITEIEQVVQRYEKKRALEERSYQSMSAFRRMFAGRKPDHHLAVEYIHYVKKPMEQIRQLRLEIEQARTIMNDSKPSDLVVVSDELEKQMN
ncbi:hypothetical protein [Paenibacillus sp. YYML68]|uniref:hypothetical protein n=1 Tax=Paenibacillus sp. YYML68 TaxID=2909250 RepID=UPI00249325A5|nr:hypothetical protein [Paenibacillus sp. YYML68]